MDKGRSINKLEVEKDWFSKSPEKHNGEINSYRTIVIIPAFNEERFIGSVILRAQKLADTVIVVDDGSSDATADISEAAGAVVIRHKQNKGKGEALNSGFCAAREYQPDIVVTIDADGQHIPEEINRIMAPVISGEADIVVGSRYLDKISKVPLHRILGHRFFNFMTSRASGVSLSDSQSGFRAFSKNALALINFNSKGFSVESEMQFLANERNLRIVEAPITISYHEKPKRPVMLHGLMVLNGILRLVGQYRPLLFLGLTGVFLILAGLIGAVIIVNNYRATNILLFEMSLVSFVIFMGGVFSLFTGIILHSIRGLLINLMGAKEPKE